jgi:hypothetical protein
MMRDVPRKAGLEMTADDHWAIGSTPHQVLRDNPGKTLLETMSEESFRDFIFGQVESVEESHRGALTGNPLEIKLLKVLLEGMLIPNIEYLREIGRLPQELEGLDPQTKFALPAKEDTS